MLQQVRSLCCLDDIERFTSLMSGHALKAGVGVPINATGYMMLEKALLEALGKAWNVQADKVLDEIERRAEELVSGGKVDSDQVEKILVKTMGDDLVRDPELVRNVIESVNRIPVFGKLEVAKQTGTGYPRTSYLDKQAALWCKENTLFFAGRYVQLAHLSDDRGGQISLAKKIGNRVGKLSFEQGLGLRDMGRMMRATIGDELGYKPLGPYYFEVVASNTAMYARRFGNISQMVSEGIQTETWRTLGDERVCEICGRLDGTVWNVADQAKNAEKIMAVRMPDDIRTVSPWIAWDANSEWEHDGKTQTGQAYYRVGDGARQYLGANLVNPAVLQNAGIGVGQVHGGCRCMRLPGGSPSQIQYAQSV